MTRTTTVFTEGMSVYMAETRPFLILSPLFLGLGVYLTLPDSAAAAFLSVTPVFAGFPVLFTLAALIAFVGSSAYGVMSRYETRIIQDREWLAATGTRIRELMAGRVLGMLAHGLMISITVYLPVLVASAAAGMSVGTSLTWFGLFTCWSVGFRFFGFLVGLLTPRHPLLGQGLASGGALVIVVVLSLLLPELSPVTLVLYRFLGAARWTEFIPMSADAGITASTLLALGPILAAMATYAVKLRSLARAIQRRGAVTDD